MAERRDRTNGLRLLFVAMYDPAQDATGPQVRIKLLSEALARDSRVGDVRRIDGGSRRRLRADLGWIASRGWSGVDVVYVEAPTSPSMPWDFAMLASARAARRPVGVFFRDAYQLFRGLYPRTTRRQILTDPLWRVSTPLLARVASVRFVPSAALGKVLGLGDAVALPPGTDPQAPDLGAGGAPLVAYVGGLKQADGFSLLLQAMARVRRSVPEARLRVVAGTKPADLPDWVEFCPSGRSGLAGVLGPVRLCVIPRPINAYSDLAVPIKLMDYLSLGKPVVATAALETANILRETGAGLVARDTPDGLAEQLQRVIEDASLAATLSRNARAAAVDPRRTWDGRAAQAIDALILPPSGTSSHAAVDEARRPARDGEAK